MGKNERQAYLKAIRSRYRRAGKKTKVTILDEFCAVCGYHRKYAIRLLNQRDKRRRKQRPGRKSIYATPEFLTALKRIWFASDQMCSKKLKASIPLWLPFYETVYKALTPETQDKLLSISSASIDPALKPVRVTQGRKGLSGTKPDSLLKNQIPIRTYFWDVTRPGFMEADTVAHCGNSLAGEFVWSLMTDIHTTWTENRATWNKGVRGVLAQIQNIEENLPFAMQGFDCDNGSEFLNHHLVRYFLYANEWSLYQNHFCPGMKLLKKQRINSKYYKKYDLPQTPYRRVLASDQVNAETKGRLKNSHQSLNPFILKKTIEKKLRLIFKQVKVTSNVRQRI